MSQYQNKVICISDKSFVDKQKEKLKPKQIEKCFYPFNDTTEAIHFLEKQVNSGEKFQYLIIDEKALDDKPTNTFNHLTDLNGFTKKMEVIVLTEKDNVDLKNNVMQYPFVSVYLMKPVPDNYIGFLME